MSLVPYGGYSRGVTSYQRVRQLATISRRALSGGVITPNEAYQIGSAIRSTAQTLYPYVSRYARNYLNTRRTLSRTPTTPSPIKSFQPSSSSSQFGNFPTATRAAAPPTMATPMDTGLQIARKIAGREFGSNGPLVEPPESSTVIIRRNYALNNDAVAVNDVGSFDMLWPIVPTLDQQTGGTITINNMHPTVDPYTRVYRQFRFEAWRVHISITRIATTNNESHFALLLPRAGVLGSLANLPLWSASLAAYAGQTYQSRYERCKADKDFKIGPIQAFPRCPDLAIPGARFSTGWRSDWITPGQLADNAEMTEDVLTSRNGGIAVIPSTNTLNMTAATFGANLGIRCCYFGDNLAGMAVDTFRIEVTHEAQVTFFDKAPRALTTYVD